MVKNMACSIELCDPPIIFIYIICNIFSFGVSKRYESLENLLTRYSNLEIVFP